MSDLAERAGPPPATETREAAHRRRLEALTTLLGDLAALGDLDALCRVAVERGPQTLGVRRMALWFRTDDPAVVSGSYGVDEHGQIRDERASRVHVSEPTLMGRVLFRGETTVMQRDAELRDDRGEIVGRGDAVIAAISAERNVLGCICADTLHSPEPMDTLQADLLFLFGAALGQIWRRVRAERDVADLEVRYRHLFETAQDAFVIFDPETHRILDANDSWLRMYRLPRERLAGVSLFDFSAESEASQIAFLKAVTTQAQSFPVRRHRRADGSVFPVEVSASSFMLNGRAVVCGVARDVSERVRAEEALRKARDELERRVRERTAELVNANQTLLVEIDQRRRAELTLRESEERFRLITRATRTGTWHWDLRRNEHTWSDELKALVGLPADTPPDPRRLLELIHPEDRDRVARLMAPPSEPAADAETEFRLLTPDGVRRLLARGSTLAGRDGRPARNVGVIVDVTELRRAQHEASEQKQAAELQRMETLAATGRMAAGIAHEINNPLQGIVAQMRLLSDELPPVLRDGRRVQLIQASVRRISEVVANLLNIHRPLRPGADSCAASGVVAAVIELIGAMAAAQGIAIQSALRPRNLVLPVSSNALTQILLNLSLNAVDAMPEGGVLRIEAARDRREVLLRVSDTGSGISPEDRQKIFSPFFTTKGPKGTGLGLAVTHSLVAAAGGVIETAPREGGGTLFLIRFPRPPATRRKPARR